jgi:hypothetical protein
VIIGLYGDSRSGKDTAAQEIVDYTNGWYHWYSFAVVLRELLWEINPILDWNDGLDGYVLNTGATYYQTALRDLGLDGMKKRYPESVELMIRLGQGARDILGEDVWVAPVMKEVDALGEHVVISDVRQPNEYDAIIERGGEVWKVVKPGTTRRAMDGLLDNRHFSVVLHNNRSIADFKLLVREEMDALSHRIH